MVTRRNEIRHERYWTVRVKRALLVYQLFDQTTIGENGCCACAEFERVDAAVLLCPLGELEVCAFLGDLVEVSEDWEGWWTGWEVFLSSSDEGIDICYCCDGGEQAEEEEDCHCWTYCGLSFHIEVSNARS